MKIGLIVIFMALSASPSFSQLAHFHDPPRAIGPVKTITDESHSVTFSQDKTRIEDRLSNGRTTVWLFTTGGKLLGSEMFEKNGRPTGTKSEYKYDTGGRLSTIVRWVRSVMSTETFTYPEPHRTQINKVFEHGSAIEIDEYDDSGNIIKATFQEPRGSLTEFYKYDDKGNPTEFTAIRAQKIIVKETYEYEFDSSGNWTKKKTTAQVTNLEPTKTTIKRKIVYY